MKLENIIMTLVIILCIGIAAYLAFIEIPATTQKIQQIYNEIETAQDNIFIQINHNTTNADILDLINKECNLTSEEEYCTSKLKDKFVTNAIR